MTMGKARCQSASGARKAPRPRDTPIPGGTLRLQERDLSLLVDLFHYGCMLRGQIQQLYFGSVQRANRRLRQLFDGGYLAKVPLPLPSCLGDPVGCQAAYRMGPAAVPIVAAQTGRDPAEIRRLQRHGTPAYLLHTVEIVQFRLAVEAAFQTNPDAALVRFLPERLCRHQYQFRERAAQAGQEAGWRREVYKPDAVLLLSRGGVLRGWAVEIDLGHTSSSEFDAKLRIHVRYAQSGLFARRYGMEKAGTLIVTTSARRLENLSALAAEVEGGRFGLTTFTELQQAGAFGAIWHTPGSPEPGLLL